MFRRAAVLVTALLALMAPLCAGDAGAVAAQTQYAAANITVAQLFERSRRSGGSFTAPAYRETWQTVSPAGETWTAQTVRYANDYRSTVTQGEFSWSYGSYRGREWHQNANGLLFPSSGLSEEVDPFANAIRRAQEPTSSVKLLGLTTETPSAFVVQVTPGRGLLEYRYYDSQTYLLARVEMTDYDGHRQTWLYRDYRTVLGRTLAGSIDYERDGNSVTLRTNLVSCERVDPSSADVAMPAARKLFDLGTRSAVVVPAHFTDGGIIVTVSIGGRGLDFLLDSGASDLLLDPDVARELGMKSSGAMRVSFAGDYTLANARAADLTVGELRASNVVFSTAPFQEDRSGQRIVGLLGTDFIASGVLKVDFEKKTLTLMRSLPADLASQGWSAIPIRLDFEVPMLRAAYSGLPGYFVADLGAYYSMLFPHYFEQFPNRIPRGMADQEDMITLGGRPFGVKHITMKRLQLGDWMFADAQVVVPSAVFAQQRDEDGLIGFDTLSSFNLIFDYDGGKLWFKPIDFGIK